jgi:hypothetical protein
MTDNPLGRWVDETKFDLGRQVRWSYLPPLMVYLAASVSGLTAIVVPKLPSIIEESRITQSFVLFMVFILINLALINIKCRIPAEPGIMVYPLWVPVMGALSCCALLISQLLPLIM